MKAQKEIMHFSKEEIMKPDKSVIKIFDGIASDEQILRTFEGIASSGRPSMPTMIPPIIIAEQELKKEAMDW
jgi:hypothetical protein